MVKSALNPKQANSFNSSLVIGPVVSWEPTVVMMGSQEVPGRTPGKPDALPTIFWARVNPLPVSVGIEGRAKRGLGSKPKASRVLSVKLRPINKGIRPPARTSSKMVSGLRVKVEMISPASLVILPW